MMQPHEHAYLSLPQWQKVLAKSQLNRSKKNYVNYDALAGAQKAADNNGNHPKLRRILLKAARL